MLYQKCANLSIIVIFNTFSDFQITVTKSCIYCLFIVATSSNNRPPSDLSDACMLYNYLKNEIISQEFNVDQKEPNCQAKSPYKTKKIKVCILFLASMNSKIRVLTQKLTLQMEIVSTIRRLELQLLFCFRRCKRYIVRQRSKVNQIY